MRSFRSACLVVVSTLILSLFCAAQAPALVTQKIDNTVRTTLKGNVHPLARAQYDQGEVPDSMTLHRLMLVLKRSDQQETALRRLIENQQNKKSSGYHQWLTPQQFGAQFGPADSDIAAVVNWLTTSGFAVNQVSNGRTVIEFDGTAGLVKQAFGTSLHQYIINGEEHIANSTDPSVPTALAPVVAGINSLHDFFSKPQNVFVGNFSRNMKTGQTVPTSPQFTFPSGCFPTGQDCDALGPYDFATIYDVLALWQASPAVNGTGQTIAIVGRTDINPNDAPTFWMMFGLGQNDVPMPTLEIKTNGIDPGFTGDEPEADIDTQWSGAVAPGATILYVNSGSTETDDGVALSAIYIVDNNLAPVMSTSYGECEAFLGTSVVDFYGTLWEQAAAQGISAMVSTGDNGAAGCDGGPDAQNGLNVNGLASTPWNAAVGGTDFAQYNKWSTYWNTSNGTGQSNAKGPIPETTWDNSCTNPLFQTLGFGASATAACNSSGLPDYIQFGGGSGGKSSYSAGVLGGAPGWATPTWQTGIPNGNDDVRDLPDVALFASNGFMGSFYVICESDATQNGHCDLNPPYGDFSGYGGTSVASPAFAGIMALVNQKYGPQGVPGLVLYQLASKEPTAFHDINVSSVNGTNTTTTNSMPCAATSPDCSGNGAQDLGVLSGYSTAAGYDLATGLGSVDAAVLVNNWNKVTFTPTNTTLTLNNGSGISGITHGSAIPVQVTVAPASGSGTPTGDVSILVAPVPGTPAVDWNTLASGTVSWATNLLPGGTYKVIAHYGGDTTFGGSYSSASSNLTINAENSSVYMGSPAGLLTPSGYTTTVTYGSNAPGCGNPEFECDNYLLRADVYNSAGQQCTTSVGGEIACPTGTISVTDNGSALDGGTFKLNSFGYTEDQGIQLTGGAHSIVASYSGDASYKASQTTASVTVAPAATSFGSVSGPSTANVNAQFTVTANISTSSWGVAPTGTVTFKANGTALTGTVQYTPSNANLQSGTQASLGASLTTSISQTGTYTLTVIYSGDTNYSSIGSTNIGTLVVSSPQNVTLPGTVSNPPHANPGQTTTTSVSIATSDGNAFASNVTFSCSGLPAGATCSFNPTQISSGASTPQTVQITVNTSGPFTGSAGGTIHALPTAKPKRKAQNENYRLWLPLTLPLAGVVFFGIAGGRIPRRYKAVGLFLMVALAVFLVACGGNSSPAPTTVTPASAQVELGGTQQFTASSSSVTWSLSSGAPGTISTSGLYTAPMTGTTPANFTVTATPTSGSAGSAAVTIPAVGVGVSPGSVNTLYPTTSGAPAQTQQFSANVTEATNTAVTWAITAGGTTDSISATGLYTAPTSVPPGPVTITATSQADTSKTGTSTVTIQTPTPAGTSTITMTATEGTATPQNTTFSLTVN